MLRVICCFLAVFLLPMAALGEAAPVILVEPVPKVRPVERPAPAPEMRWRHRPEADRWTRAAMSALRTHGAPLVATVPRDIDNWCPAYPQASEAGRRAFWVGLISALVKHESTYRPRAVGGGGKWYGLTQILPSTARGYGCRARSGEALKDGVANLSCAIRIMAVTVPRDGVVSKGMRGVAADWGPFYSRKKREDMRSWVRKQPYCVGLGDTRPRVRPAALGPRRPVARPVRLAMDAE